MSEIKDGLGSKISFADGFDLRQIEITGFTVVGGEKIDLTGLSNTEWRTAYPKTLKDVEDITFTYYFDPAEVDSAPINTNQLVTLTYPDGAKHEFWGALTGLGSGTIVEGDAVRGEATVAITNLNGSDVETGPAYTAAP